MNESTEKPKYQLFSSTDHPISKDTMLWRYLTFEKFVWLMEKSSLNHTRLDCLGDPFEGSLTRPHVQKRNSRPFDEDGIPAPVRQIFNMWSRLCNFATCWHASPVESAALWKLYSREEAGVAIISTPGRMIEGVELTPYNTAILGPVEYKDFDKEDMSLPFGKQAMPAFLKRKSFEHENEVRGSIILGTNTADPIMIPPPNDLDGVMKLAKELPRVITVKVKLKILIQHIWISPLAHSWFIDLVRMLSDRHGLGQFVHPSGLLGEPVY